MTNHFPFDTALFKGWGFISSYLADRLTNGSAVTVCDNLSADHRKHIPADARLIEADVTNQECLTEGVRDADTVFHEAAHISVTKSVEDPKTAYGT